MAKIKRMWVNQPSTLQPYHKFHGQNVLVYDPDPNDKYVEVFFLSGEVISQMMNRYALAPGWKTDER